MYFQARLLEFASKLGRCFHYNYQRTRPRTIKALADAGRDMNSKYKETSEAGLAQNLVLC